MHLYFQILNPQDTLKQFVFIDLNIVGHKWISSDNDAERYVNDSIKKVLSSANVGEDGCIVLKKEEFERIKNDVREGMILKVGDRLFEPVSKFQIMGRVDLLDNVIESVNHVNRDWIVISNNSSGYVLKKAGRAKLCCFYSDSDGYREVNETQIPISRYFRLMFPKHSFVQKVGSRCERADIKPENYVTYCGMLINNNERIRTEESIRRLLNTERMFNSASGAGASVASGAGASVASGVGASGAGASNASGAGASVVSGVGASNASGVGASNASDVGALNASGVGASGASDVDALNVGDPKIVFTCRYCNREYKIEGWKNRHETQCHKRPIQMNKDGWAKKKAKY